MNSQKFSDFGFIEPIYHALRDIEYTVPTPVQVQAIPPLMAGRDLLGCAQTGTGKTAAFALPIIQHIAKNPRRRERGFVRVLIVTPTRELAAQIHENVKMYSKYLDIHSVVIFGGVGQNPQVKNLARGADILVATPGRLLDLIGQGHIRLQNVEIFVLDEADRMLDMGFIPDIRRILGFLPKQRQTMFLSATMPPKIVQLSKGMVNDPVRVDVTPEKPVVELIDQRLIMAEVKQKTTVLINILKDPAVNRALVFTRTKHGANKLVRLLGRAGIGALGIHGNKAQTARQKAMDDFKSGRIRVLVATDIAARGIDVEGITHVINHDIPNVAETYVHRIGRTARAGSAGISISLCSPEERSFVRDIEKLIKQDIPVINEKHFMANVELKPESRPPQPVRQMKRPRGPPGQDRRERPGGNSAPRQHGPSRRRSPNRNGPSNHYGSASGSSNRSDAQSHTSTGEQKGPSEHRGYRGNRRR